MDDKVEEGVASGSGLASEHQPSDQPLGQTQAPQAKSLKCEE